MARNSSNPRLIDYCKQIDISFLKKHGYLESGIIKTGTINWTLNRLNTGSIGIKSDTTNQIPIITLTYLKNETEYEYSIELCASESNLGIGQIWWFICPITGLLCRKLYLGPKYFAHRKTLGHAMYSKQTESRKSRNLGKLFERLFIQDELFLELTRPYLKRTYAGKQTKKYKRLQSKAYLMGYFQSRESKLKLI